MNNIYNDECELSEKNDVFIKNLPKKIIKRCNKKRYTFNQR